MGTRETDRQFKKKKMGICGEEDLKYNGETARKKQIRGRDVEGKKVR